LKLILAHVTELRRLQSADCRRTQCKSWEESECTPPPSSSHQSSEPASGHHLHGCVLESSPPSQECWAGALGRSTYGTLLEPTLTAGGNSGRWVGADGHGAAQGACGGVAGGIGACAAVGPTTLGSRSRGPGCRGWQGRHMALGRGALEHRRAGVRDVAKSKLV
jgi:hypothetical protein